MDIKKLFLQIISILLVVVVVVCVGTAIKRSGEPEKEYDFSDRNNSQDAEDWEDTEDILEDTEGGSEIIDEPVATTPQNKIMYTTSAVNVRSGPGRGYDWLGRLELGAEVTAVGDAEGEWQQVIYNGQTAYIAVEYLEVREEAESPSTGDTGNAVDGGTGNAGAGDAGAGAGTGGAGTGAGGSTTTPGGTTPSNPVTPPTTDSGTSETPSTPDTPSNPDTPDTPSEPEVPVVPDTPSEPESPDEPEAPSGSEGDSETPEAPSESEGQDILWQLGRNCSLS